MPGPERIGLEEIDRLVTVVRQMRHEQRRGNGGPYGGGRGQNPDGHRRADRPPAGHRCPTGRGRSERRGQGVCLSCLVALAPFGSLVLPLVCLSWFFDAFLFLAPLSFLPPVEESPEPVLDPPLDVPSE